jgi:hypothetical protein
VTTRAAVEVALASLLRDFAARYGEDLSRLVVDGDGGGLVVRGTVVVRRQLRALEQVARELMAAQGAAGEGGEVRLEVVVLAELADEDPRADGRRLRHPGAARQDLEPVAVPLWSRRVGGERVSEWLPSDGPARVLHESSERWLVQVPDGTVGWCEREHGLPFLPESGAPPAVRPWPEGRPFALATARRRALFAAAREAARAELPYRLGGRDPATGLDCSAFVQRLLAEQTGEWLPRHTSDQLRIGERVARPKIGAGDLVFARAQHKSWLHVGLALDGESGEARPVAHACRVEGRVLIEPLGRFLERYRFLRAQRVLRPPEAGEGG